MISKNADTCCGVMGKGSGLIADKNICRVVVSQKVVPCYQGSLETIDQYKAKILSRLRSKYNNLRA